MKVRNLALILMAALLTQASSRVAPDPIEKVRRDAYNYAVSCGLPKGMKPRVKFEEITWYTVPANLLVMKDSETGEVFYAIGYYYSHAKEIWVTAPFERNKHVLAHEAMHAIGFHGHPDEPFKRCGLQAEQFFK